MIRTLIHPALFPPPWINIAAVLCVVGIFVELWLIQAWKCLSIFSKWSWKAKSVDYSWLGLSRICFQIKLSCVVLSLCWTFFFWNRNWSHSTMQVCACVNLAFLLRFATVHSAKLIQYSAESDFWASAGNITVLRHSS